MVENKEYSTKDREKSKFEVETATCFGRLGHILIYFGLALSFKGF